MAPIPRLAARPHLHTAIKDVLREAQAMRVPAALNRIAKRQFATMDRLSSSKAPLQRAQTSTKNRDPVQVGK